MMSKFCFSCGVAKHIAGVRGILKNTKFGFSRALDTYKEEVKKCTVIKWVLSRY